MDSQTLTIPKIDVFDESVLKKVGNTPLLRLKSFERKFGKDVEIYAKAEWMNPGGSVKMRPALRMVQDGIKAGKFGKGKILLDSTSGNTGVAYALLGKIMEFDVHLVLPENVCKERKGMMAQQYTAKLILSDPMKQSDGAIVLAQEIYDKDPEKYFLPDQYNNPSNWMAHRDTTSKEIYEQTKGTVTHFLAGIGTSGTLMGVSRGLKAVNAEIKTYAVEPAEALHGLEGLKHMDSSIVPGIYDTSLYNEKISIKTEDAYAMVNRIEKEEGLLVGHSSAAALVGTLRLIEKVGRGVFVMIFPDSCGECKVLHGVF